MTQETLFDKKILSLWHNIKWKGSFTGIKTFQTLLKTDKNIDVSEKKLYSLLKTDPLYLKHLRPVRKINRRSYDLTYYGQLLQGDIAHMFEDDGYNYFLAIIDCFSLKVFCKPLKTKTSEEVLNAFKELINKFNVEITKFESDQGKEFSKVRQFCSQNKIIFNFKFGNNKANFSEWIIMIIKRKLYKVLRDKKIQTWTKYLSIISDQFNDIPQKKNGFLKPNEITNIYDTAFINDQKTVNTYKQQNNAQKKYENNKNNLQRNDYVYLTFNQKIFDKSFDVQVKMTKTLQYKTLLLNFIFIC